MNVIRIRNIHQAERNLLDGSNKYSEIFIVLSRLDTDTSPMVRMHIVGLNAFVCVYLISFHSAYIALFLHSIHVYYPYKEISILKTHCIDGPSLFKVMKWLWIEKRCNQIHPPLPLNNANTSLWYHWHEPKQMNTFVWFVFGKANEQTKKRRSITK